MAVVNRAHDVFVVTVCGPGRLSRPLPVTTTVVARDDANELRTFRVEESFFTPRPHGSELGRIEAIVFRR